MTKKILFFEGAGGAPCGDVENCRITGFSKYGVWGEVEINTISECIPMRVN